MQQTPEGQEIPVPSRDAVFRDLAKVAKSDKPAPTEDNSPFEDE